MTVNKFLVFSPLMAVALSGGMAAAGTKFQANLVPANAGPGDFLAAASSKALMTGKGSIQIKASKVTDSAGALVTDSAAGVGNQYVGVVSGVAAGVSWHLNILLTGKNGAVSAKYSALTLVSLAGTTPPGNSIVITGVDVHKPTLAADVAACTAILGGAVPGVVLDPAPNACASGALIGSSGVQAGF